MDLLNFTGFKSKSAGEPFTWMPKRARGAACAKHGAWTRDHPDLEYIRSV